MLTKLQKQTLVSMVRQNQHILFAKFGPDVTRKKKEAIWTFIHERLTSLGADLPSVRYVRDFEWGNLKRAAAKRRAENKMTELDQIVMEIVANSSSSSTPDPGSENIVVTPTVFGDGSSLTAESSSTPQIRGLPTLPPHLTLTKAGRESSVGDQGTNGHSDFYPTGSLDLGSSGDLDIALILLNKKKVELENQLLKLQTIQVREKTRQDKELFRLNSSKIEAEIQTEKLKSEKLKREMDLIILRANEIKDGSGNNLDPHGRLTFKDQRHENDDDDDELLDREPIDLVTTHAQ